MKNRYILSLIVWLLVTLVCTAAQQLKQSPANRETSGPLRRLAGEWQITYFVMGGGVATFGNCGATKIEMSSGNSIGLSLESLTCPHERVKTWQFLLKRGTNEQGYSLTIKGGEGPVVENMAIAYSQDLGWQAKLPNNEKGLPVEAAVKPMPNEGWEIYVGSPDDTRLADIPKLEMKVYLRAIKK